MLTLQEHDALHGTLQHHDAGTNAYRPYRYTEDHLRSPLATNNHLGS